jgi:L(+)-tartrate dehydratase beta subunit
MAHYNLTTPLSEAHVRKLKVRDTVILNGHIFGIRDATQIRMFDQQVDPPISLADSVCLHTAPSLKKVGDKWYKICVGTTTSTRMERFTPLLLEKYGVRAIVGKAGLLEGSLEAMRKCGACYLAIVGGVAALETMQIEEVEDVFWEDLHPEALYKFRVREFGPLIVAMDSYGNNLYFEVKEQAFKKTPQLYKKLQKSKRTGQYMTLE